MKRKMISAYLRASDCVKAFLKEDRGDTNIISIILIIIVVIALVAIFRQQLTEIVNGLFRQIKESLGLG